MILYFVFSSEKIKSQSPLEIEFEKENIKNFKKWQSFYCYQSAHLKIVKDSKRETLLNNCHATSLFLIYKSSRSAIYFHCLQCD